MPGACRRTDTHEGICSHGAECCPHFVTGSFIEGSPDTFANGLEVVRIGDELEHNCPHCGYGWADEGSPDTFANGIAVHRLGDKVIYPGGEGVSTSASDDVIVN